MTHKFDEQFEQTKRSVLCQTPGLNRAGSGNGKFAKHGTFISPQGAGVAAPDANDSGGGRSRQRPDKSTGGEEGAVE